MVSTAQAPLTVAKNHLLNPSNINKPKQALFKGIHDCKVHASMVLFLDCNVFLPGLKGVGVQKLQGIITMSTLLTYSSIHMLPSLHISRNTCAKYSRL